VSAVTVPITDGENQRQNKPFNDLTEQKDCKKIATGLGNQKLPMKCNDLVPVHHLDLFVLISPQII